MAKHLLQLVVLSSCTLLGAAPGQEVEPGVIGGALLGNSLVVLFDDGSLAAWSMPSGEEDAQLAHALGVRKFSKMASSGDELWGVDGEAIFRWNSNDRQWVEEAPQYGDDLEALAVVGQDLMQVYPRTIVGTRSGRKYRVPKLGGQLKIDYLRVLALHSQGEVLWIGTGQGEWGGHLVDLNTRTGEWNSYYDPLHYVTGITSSTDDAVLVSWSMSHFYASTLIRAHASDTEVVQEFEELKDRYYQRISFSPYESRLYGIERNSLVKIDSGVPAELADLGQLRYDSMPDAIGVAPAIVAVLPVDAGTVVILHRHSAPMLFRRGQLERLSR